MVVSQLKRKLSIEVCEYWLSASLADIQENEGHLGFHFEARDSERMPSPESAQQIMGPCSHQNLPANWPSASRLRAALMCIRSHDVHVALWTSGSSGPTVQSAEELPTHLRR